MLASGDNISKATNVLGHLLPVGVGAEHTQDCGPHLQGASGAGLDHLEGGQRGGSARSEGGGHRHRRWPVTLSEAQGATRGRPGTGSRLTASSRSVFPRRTSSDGEVGVDLGSLRTAELGASTQGSLGAGTSGQRQSRRALALEEG